jgi:parallel beta-helix repeat protein
MTTYYVSSQIGDDDNVGTSAAAPFATLQVAANHTAPGDTVLVMNGTYTSGDPVLNITIGGTASAPITYAAAPGQTPVIDSSGNWNAIDVRASYIIISGFTIVGNAASITWQQALANASPDTPFYNGNGIAVHDASHVIIQNNTIHDEPGGGIYTEGADYVQILNNIVYNNAHWSVYGNSGISVAASVSADAAPGPHIIISGNLVYGNSELVPEYRAGAITDGEGIILDSNSGYTGGFLVQNNTVHDNGGPGIEAFLSNNAIISLNIVYGNNTQNVQAPSVSQLFINQSDNVTITNNSMGDPALTTYLQMYGAPPSSTELWILTEFVAAQSSYGQLIGVLDPTVYVYEALGAALASGSDTGSTAFADTWGPLAIASDTTFTIQAYANVFATPGTSAQIQHFMDQINFFKSLYTASGAYGTDANQIDLLARGAIYGQMLGVKAELTDVALVGVSGQPDITHDLI